MKIRLSLDNASRPSAWFLGPAGAAMLLFGLAHGDPWWMGLCFLAILSAYVTDLRLSWPRTRDALAAVLGLAAMAGVAALYFSTVLRAGVGLQYFPRILFSSKLFSPLGLILGALLVYVWHVPFVPKERGWAIHLLVGLLILCGGQFLQPSALFGAVLLFYCVAQVAALFLAGAGHQAHGRLLWPGGRQLGWFVFWGAFLAMGTWLVIRGLHQLEHNMSRWIGDMIQTPRYSGQLSLGHTMRLQRRHTMRLSPRLVASIRAARRPSYLRLRALPMYHKGLWYARAHPKRLLPGETRNDTSGSQYLLWSLGVGGASKPLSEAQATHVRAFLRLGKGVMLGYGARQLKTRLQARCSYTPSGEVLCFPSFLLNRYSFWSTQARSPWGVGLQSLPETSPSRAIGARKKRSKRSLLRRAALEKVLKQLRPLAQKLAGGKSVLQAAQRLQGHFRSQHRYSLQVKLATKGDPTVDFVLHRRPGYCQYFASGLALMLRALGHRARVATGFLAREDVGAGASRRWLIRQRDAHAWTEAFDPKGRRWVAFDATPPAAMEELLKPPKEGQISRLITWLKVRWKELVASWRELPLLKWLTQETEWLRVLFLSPYGWGFFAVLALVVWVWRRKRAFWQWIEELFRRKGRPREAPKEEPLSAPRLQAGALLEELFGLWRGYGIVPTAQETLESFAKRVLSEACEAPKPSPRDLQRCVALYNRLRFGTLPPDEAAVLDELSQAIALVEAQLSPPQSHIEPLP